MELTDELTAAFPSAVNLTLRENQDPDIAGTSAPNAASVMKSIILGDRLCWSEMLQFTPSSEVQQTAPLHSTIISIRAYFPCNTTHKQAFLAAELA